MANPADIVAKRARNIASLADEVRAITPPPVPGPLRAADDVLAATGSPVLNLAAASARKLDPATLKALQAKAANPSLLSIEEALTLRAYGRTPESLGLNPTLTRQDAVALLQRIEQQPLADAELATLRPQLDVESTPNDDIARAIEEAQLVAARQRRVPLVPEQGPSPNASRTNIGGSASAALGDRIPRPRPATEPLALRQAGPSVSQPEPSVPPGEIAPVVGGEVGDLTDSVVAAPDNLSASAIEVDAPPSRTLQLKPAEIDNLAAIIRQATVPSGGEPVAGLKKLWNKFNNLSDDTKRAVLESPRLADGIETARDDAARAVAVAGAQSRLDALQQMAGVSTADLGAQQVASAAAARASANTPRVGAQPTVMAPGARQLDVAVEDVPDAELPGMAESSRAAAREAATNVRLTPGGGLPQSTRLAAGNTDDARKLPLYLKGDATGRLDRRSVGYRGLETNDIRVLKPLLEARERLAAAKSADEMAAAQADILAAELDLNRKYSRSHTVPGYVYTDSEGNKVRVPAETHTGRPAMSDKKLNRTDQQTAYNEMLVGMVGSRPRSDVGLVRSSPDMTPAERAASNADIAEAYPDNAQSWLPDDPVMDADEPGSSGKRQRLGGSQRLSRLQGSMRAMLGSSDPFSLVAPDDNGILQPVFRNGRDVAREILSKQDLAMPGDDWYEMAMDKLAREIDEAYQPRGSAAAQDLRKAEMAASPTAPASDPAGLGVGTSLDVSALPANQSVWPEGRMRQTAVSGPQPAGENAIDLPEPSAPRRDFSLPPADEADVVSFPRRGQRPVTVPMDDADGSSSLAASATEVGPVTGEPVELSKNRPRPVRPEVAPVAGEQNTAAIIEQIQKDADMEFRRALQQAQDDGLTGQAAIDEANLARRTFVEREKAARIKPVQGAAESTPDSSPAPEINPVEAPAAKGGGKKGGKKGGEKAADADTPPKDADVDQPKVEADRPKDSDVNRPKDAGDGKPAKAPQPDGPPAKKGLLRRAAALGTVGLIGGSAYLAWKASGAGRNGPGGGGDVPFPFGPPGGGGGEGGGGGGEFVPVPVGGAAGKDSAIMDAFDREADIQRALNRIRDAQSQGNRPMYQTIGNYN